MLTTATQVSNVIPSLVRERVRGSRSCVLRLHATSRMFGRGTRFETRKLLPVTHHHHREIKALHNIKTKIKHTHKQTRNQPTRTTSVVSAVGAKPSGSVPALMLDCRSGMEVGAGSVHAEAESDTLRVAAHSTQAPGGAGSALRDSSSLRANKGKGYVYLQRGHASTRNMRTRCRVEVEV